MNPAQLHLLATLSFDRWTEVLPKEVPIMKALQKKGFVVVDWWGIGILEDLENRPVARLNPKLKLTRLQKRLLGRFYMPPTRLLVRPKERRTALALEKKGYITLQVPPDDDRFWWATRTSVPDS